MKNTNLKRIACIVLAVVMILSMTGCAAIKSWFSRAKESLVGNNFTIITYDHYGNATLKLSGTKVHVGILENSANFNSENSGFESEVLEFTINGSEVYQIGDTAVIAEEGLDMITDFSIDEDIEVESGGGFMPFDRCVNDYANLVGKAKVVLISSQMGIPIGVYQGDSVYVEVPEDLPKMTLLNIDGKALYISRANYTIIDAKLLKG
jgi:hypothetical protein